MSGIAGLSNGSKFSCKWLYSNHYDEFLINLTNSEFKEYLPIFDDPESDFYDYDKYFIKCKSK